MGRGGGGGGGGPPPPGGGRGRKKKKNYVVVVLLVFVCFFVFNPLSTPFGFFFFFFFFRLFSLFVVGFVCEILKHFIPLNNLLNVGCIATLHFNLAIRVNASPIRRMYSPESGDQRPSGWDFA